MNQNKLRSIIDSQPYDIMICILAIVSVVLAVIDYNHGLSPVENAIDQTVYFVFVFDYFARLKLSPNKKKFFKSNLMDLIAIFPLRLVLQILRALRFVRTLRVFDFTTALRIFRFAKAFRAIKFAKLLHLAKLARLGSVFGRLGAKTKKFLNTNGFKYVLVLTLSAIVAASIAMTYLEEMSFPDALWWSFVTTTTVGYGDLAPVTYAGRAVAILLMLVGIGLIGALTSSITTFFLAPSPKNEPSSQRVDLVFKMYEELDPNEQEMFKKKLTK